MGSDYITSFGPDCCCLRAKPVYYSEALQVGKLGTIHVYVTTGAAWAFGLVFCHLYSSSVILSTFSSSGQLFLN